MMVVLATCRIERNCTLALQKGGSESPPKGQFLWIPLACSDKGLGPSGLDEIQTNFAIICPDKNSKIRQFPISILSGVFLMGSRLNDSPSDN